MVNIQDLYLRLETENKYNDLDEEKILNGLLKVKMGSVESAISNLINQAVLTHMNLNIDSTIMQMLVLNDYLINLFIKNFERLMHNYIIHYLESLNVTSANEEEQHFIKSIISTMDMKTEFEGIRNILRTRWNIIK